MSRLLQYVFALAFSVFAATSVQAQDYESLYRDFDPDTLVKSEKVFLQTALAMEGHYVGLIDGAWGKGSKEALRRYSRKEFNTRSENWHIAVLAWSFFELIQRDGWDVNYVEPARISLLWPYSAIVQDASSEHFVNYRHTKSSLGISLGIHDKNTAQSIHNYVQSRHQIDERAYSVRTDRMAISTAKRWDKTVLYVRSDLIDGTWSSVMLSAHQQDEPILTTVAASLKARRSAPLIIVSDGTLDRAIRKTLALVEDNNTQEAQAVKAVPDTSSRETGASGSGFIVSHAGHVVTNAHVVEQCHDYFVDSMPAEIVAVSEEFDLALLRVPFPKGKTVAVFSASAAKLNSDVTAVGYPYAGLLGGLNITRGSVSSLKGLGGNATTMQISAPVQSGNSGGPLLAADGEVVGVVVSKLDAEKVANLMGDVPQNVNFAIRGEITQLFMAQNGIDPLLSLTDDKLAPEDLAEKALGFTTFVECR